MAGGHPSRCFLIQTWIRLKKLYIHGKWQNQFTHKFLSILIICRNFIWMKNRIYITTFSEKFPNQWKKQTNSKVAFNILPLYNASSWIWWLAKSAQNKLVSQTYLLQIYYKFNVCFIRSENLVYQNNPFIIYTVIL